MADLAIFLTRAKLHLPVGELQPKLRRKVDVDEGNFEEMWYDKFDFVFSP
ncbi:MAG: hypothetical protein F6K42_20725 [Leptolyngbya sp. SIO1D8]|nr:hypothetical protein [Leptolyngbya sp. SIO1D8]